MTALLFSMWMLVADASAHTVRLCGQWTPWFYESVNGDIDGVDANGDGDPDNDVADFMTTHSPQPLRGVYAMAQRQEANGTWSTMWAGYLPVTGADAGCTGAFATTPSPPFQLHRVRLRAWSIAHADGHYLTVYDDDVTEDLGFVESPVVVATGSTMERCFTPSSTSSGTRWSATG